MQYKGVTLIDKLLSLVKNVSQNDSFRSFINFNEAIDFLVLIMCVPINRGPMQLQEKSETRSSNTKCN